MISVDTEAMRIALAGFLEGLKPLLSENSVEGTKARMISTALLPFFEAVAAEMDRQTDAADIYVAIIRLLSHMASSSVRTFDIEEISEQKRAVMFMNDVLVETLQRLQSGTFAKVNIEQAGRA